MNFWIYYAILIILLLASVILSYPLYAWDNQEHGLFINAQYPTIVLKQYDFSPHIKIFDIDGMGYGDWRHTVKDANVTLTIGYDSVSGKTNKYGFYSGAIKMWKTGYVYGTITAEKGELTSSLDIMIYVIERAGSDPANENGKFHREKACDKSGGKPPFC